MPVFDIQVRADQAVRELSRYRSSLSGAGAATTRFSSGVVGALGTLGIAAAGAAIAFTPVFVALRTFSSLARAAARAGEEFQNQMNVVAAVSGATGGEFEALTMQARELGRTTRFTAVQAAQGMEFLARAGLNATEVMGALPGTLNLAAAGALELADAANITTNVLSQFGLAAEESARVADILAATAASSNTNVEQLGQAFSFVGPVARAFNVSVEETSAVLGALGNAGIQATRAGFGLRGIMAALRGPTARAKDALADMGLSVADVNVEAHGLINVLELLFQRGIEQGSRAFDIFGRLQATPVLALRNQIEALDALRAMMGNVEGAAERMARIMERGLPGAIRRFRSAVEGATLSIGEQGFTEALEGAIRAMTDMIERNQELIQSIGTFLAEAFLFVANGISQAVFQMQRFLANASAFARITSFFSGRNLGERLGREGFGGFAGSLLQDIADALSERDRLVRLARGTARIRSSLLVGRDIGGDIPLGGPLPGATGRDPGMGGGGGGGNGEIDAEEIRDIERAAAHASQTIQGLRQNFRRMELREEARESEELAASFRRVQLRAQEAAEATEERLARAIVRVDRARTRALLGLAREVNLQTELAGNTEGSAAQRRVEAEVINFTNQLRERGVTLQTEEIENIRALFAELERLDQAASAPFRRAAEGLLSLRDVIQNEALNAINSLSDELANLFETGSFNIRRLADVIIQQLTRLAVQILILRPIIGALGGVAGGGGFAGALAGAIGALGGSGQTTPTSQFGGTFNRGQLFIAGENGPELIASAGPGRSRVTPVGSGGGFSVNNIFNFPGADPESFRRSQAQISTVLGQSIQNALRQSGR